MKLKQAQDIVAKMVLWTMRANGITPKEIPQPITEDLKTLIRANDIVDKYNKIPAKEGKSKTIHMTLADRGIAAIYVAANFQGTTTDEVQVLAEHNNNIVICLNKNELKD